MSKVPLKVALQLGEAFRGGQVSGAGSAGGTGLWQIPPTYLRPAMGQAARAELMAMGHSCVISGRLLDLSEPVFSFSKTVMMNPDLQGSWL